MENKTDGDCQDEKSGTKGGEGGVNKKKLLAVTIIILGSFLEVYYYVWKYTSEGESLWLGVLKGAALTIFTIGLALLLRRHWLFSVAISLSILYSIFCTSSGQATSYAHRYNADQSVILTQQKEYEETTTERAILLSDIETLKDQKREKEQARDEIPISQRSAWQFVGFDSDGDARYQKAESTVFQTLNEEILEYNQQIQEAQARLDALPAPPVLVQEKETDSYAILKAMTGLSEVAWQYILQSMFSLFAAIMAPIGITLLRKEEPKQEPDPESEIDCRPFVRFWVKWSWYPFRNGKSKKILPKKALMEYAKDNNPGLTEEICDKIKSECFCLSAIDEDDNILYNNERKLIESILEVCNAERKRPRVRGKKGRGRQP